MSSRHGAVDSASGGDSRWDSDGSSRSMRSYRGPDGSAALVVIYPFAQAQIETRVWSGRGSRMAVEIAKLAC